MNNVMEYEVRTYHARAEHPVVQAWYRSDRLPLSLVWAKDILLDPEFEKMEYVVGGTMVTIRKL